MRPIEFNGVIGRTQDFSQLKQSEDSKPAVIQQQLAHNSDKTVELKSEQVYQKQDKDMDSEYDASKEGRGGFYEEQHDKKKKDKKEEDGKVMIKGRNITFDIKI